MASSLSSGSPMDWEASRIPTPVLRRGTKRARDSSDGDLVSHFDTRGVPNAEIYHLSELVDAQFNSSTPYPDGYMVGGWPASLHADQVVIGNNIALMTGALPSTQTRKRHDNATIIPHDASEITQRYGLDVLFTRHSEPTMSVRGIGQAGRAKRACLELASYAYTVKDAAVAINLCAMTAAASFCHAASNATAAVCQTLAELVRKFLLARPVRTHRHSQLSSENDFPPPSETDGTKSSMSNKKLLKSLDEQTQRYISPAGSRCKEPRPRSHSTVEGGGDLANLPLREDYSPTSIDKSTCDVKSTEQSSTSPFRRMKRLFPKQRLVQSPKTLFKLIDDLEDPSGHKASVSSQIQLLPPETGHQREQIRQDHADTVEQHHENDAVSQLTQKIHDLDVEPAVEDDEMSDVSSTVDPDWLTPVKYKIPPAVPPESLAPAKPAFTKPPLSNEVAKQRTTRAMALKVAREKEEAARRLQEEAAKRDEERRRFQIKPLNSEWEAKVDEALNRGHGNYSKADMSRVVPPNGASGTAGWLNDETINGYLKLICEQGNKGQKAGSVPNYHAFNSFFMTNLLTKGYSSIARWPKRANIDGKKLMGVECVFIPINHGSHWTLLLVSPTSRAIRYYDSLGGSGNKFIDQAKIWLKGQLGNDFNPASWTATTAVSPRQSNMSDCGVFTVTTAKVLMQGGSPMSYGPPQIPTQRRRMVAELVAGRLL